MGYKVRPYKYKAFSVRFGFDDVKLRRYKHDSQKQGNENAP